MERVSRVYRRTRVDRFIPDRLNPLESLSFAEVKTFYRFGPETIIWLVNFLGLVAKPSMRGCPLPPLLELLVTLSFYASGSFYHVVGHMGITLPKSTVCRVIHKITDRIVDKRGQVIRLFNRDTTREGFYELTGA
jgi:hypothetical protein